MSSSEADRQDTGIRSGRTDARQWSEGRDAGSGVTGEDGRQRERDREMSSSSRLLFPSQGISW